MGGLTFCFCISSHFLQHEPNKLVSPEPNSVMEVLVIQCSAMPARPFATLGDITGRTEVSQPCFLSLASEHPYYKSLGYWMVPCFRPVEMKSPCSASSPGDISVRRLAMQQAAHHHAWLVTLPTRTRLARHRPSYDQAYVHRGLPSEE